MRLGMMLGIVACCVVRAWSASVPVAERPQVKAAMAQTEACSFSSAGGTLLYRLHKPKTIVPGRKYPLVVFFHGAGERGADNVAQLVHGVNDILAYARKTGEELYLIAGQVPNGQLWVDTPWAQLRHSMPEKPSRAMGLALELVEKTMRDCPIDVSRVYVTGISMGGYGTWDAVQRRPDLWAAAIPVCGGGDMAYAEKIRNVPIWCFHGDVDGAVPTSRSRDMVAALWKVKGKIRYREYPNVNHNCWDMTYRDDAVLNWLFAQKKVE